MVTGPTIDVRQGRAGFTLIELLVVFTIIVVLIGILIPVIGVIRNSTYATYSRHQVLAIGTAMRGYADEDRRHFFPTPLASKQLTYGTSTTILALLEPYGFQIPFDHLEATSKALLDGWRRPVRYQLDGPYFSGPGVVDSSAMNGTADRPAADAAWNPKSVEPFAYVWSLGKPSGAGETTDALPANVSAWIYQKGTP